MAEAPTSVATADPPPAPPAGEVASASAPATPETPAPSGAEYQAVAKAAEAVYDEAFAKHLSPETKAASATTAPETPDRQSDGDSGGDGFTAEQTQLLSRLHMTPAMLGGWTDEQKAEFLTNAAKREADNTRSYKDLKDKLSAMGANDPESPEGSSKPDASSNPESPESSPATGGDGDDGGFVAAAEKAAADAAEVYGDEIKPMGDLTVNMAKRLQATDARLQRAEQSSSLKDQLIVEMTLDQGISALTKDFPSLEKPDARQRVIDRFAADWKKADHSQEQGPLLARLRAGLKAAAQAEFSQTTESDAQLALANKTKQRLKNQPQAGTAATGKGRAAPQTADDVYDQAFNEILKPALSA